MKALRIAIYGILLAVVAFLLINTYRTTGTVDASTLTKAGLLAAGIVISMLRPARRRTRASIATYRKAYADFVSDAFLEDKKLERKFFSAVADYNRNRPESALRKLAALMPECTGSRERYAVTVFTALCSDDAGLYEDAVRHYDAALRIRPSSTLYSNMGLCCQRLGKTDMARDALDHAVALDSGNAFAWTNLSVLCFREGDYESALRYSQEALKRNATMKQALSTAAVCSALLGCEEDYQRYYRQAVANGYDGAKIKQVVESLK